MHSTTTGPGLEVTGGGNPFSVELETFCTKICGSNSGVRTVWSAVFGYEPAGKAIAGLAIVGGDKDGVGIAGSGLVSHNTGFGTVAKVADVAR